MKTIDRRNDSIVLELTHDELETIGSALLIAKIHLDKKAWQDLEKRTMRTEKQVLAVYDDILKLFPLIGD